jgi:hypothetical protein
MWGDWLDPNTVGISLFLALGLTAAVHVVLGFLIFRDGLNQYPEDGIFKLHDKVLKFSIPSRYTIYFKYFAAINLLSVKLYAIEL